MAAVIIRQKDVKRLASTLLNEIFNFLHDEYILTEFKEMKEVQKEFLNSICVNHINTLHKQNKITKEKREELIKPFLNNGESIKVLYNSKLVEDAMKDEGIDTEGIYQTLNKLTLDMEIDEDLYYKTKAFLDIFRVFENGYSYLEN